MPTSLEVRGDIGRIVLTDIFDFTVQDDFQEVADETLNNKKIINIAVDMAGVTFIDSSAIRLLLLLHRNAVAAGKTVILRNCREGILEILTIGGFDQILNIR